MNSSLVSSIAIIVLGVTVIILYVVRNKDLVKIKDLEEEVEYLQETYDTLEDAYIMRGEMIEVISEANDDLMEQIVELTNEEVDK